MKSAGRSSASLKLPVASPYPAPPATSRSRVRGLMKGAIKKGWASSSLRNRSSQEATSLPSIALFASTASLDTEPSGAEIAISASTRGVRPARGCLSSVACQPRGRRASSWAWISRTRLVPRIALFRITWNIPFRGTANARPPSASVAVESNEHQESWFPRREPPFEPGVSPVSGTCLKMSRDPE
jgi:hypothetical protein